MKTAFSILAFITGMLTAGSAQTATTFVSGKVEFTIINMGLPVEGTMEATDLQFKQPAADPTTWTLEGSAAPATILTGIALRDKHLKKSDYFNADQYPAIRLQSTSIRAKGKNMYEGTFTLMLKGIAKAVIIPFSIVKNGDSNTIAGEFTINRLDYGLGEESSILADNVKIRVSAVFKVL